MEFRNPYAEPVRLAFVLFNNRSITVSWQSERERFYDVEATADFRRWTKLMTSLLASGSELSVDLETSSEVKFLRVVEFGRRR